MENSRLLVLVTGAILTKYKLFASGLAALFMIIGTLLMLPAYPIYRRKAFKTRTELTPEILCLSEEIMRQ